MSSKMKVLGSVAAAAALGVGLASAVVGPAAASAYGCTGFGFGVSYKGAYVLNGTYCGTINGRGTYVNYIGGNAYNHIPGQNFCNWEIKADFYDTSGRWRDWASSGVRTGCTLTPESYAGVYRWVPQGSVLITLKSNGAIVSQVREAIY